jgi:hypothetical protein
LKKTLQKIVFATKEKIVFPQITLTQGDEMVYKSNATLQTLPTLRSEQTEVYKFDSTPESTLNLRADQWIMVEEALLEQANIQYHISQENYTFRRWEQAQYTYDKASELETLAKAVGIVIELLQANKENA